MRFYDLDFSRALLLGLGIVLHAACLCGEINPNYNVLYDFIHSFRMPAFFLLAGFFAARKLREGNPFDFLSSRVRRLGIPFLFCGLIVNPLFNCPNHVSWLGFAAEAESKYWFNGDWLQHLWFLSCLLQYVVVAYCVNHFCPNFNRFLQQRRFGVRSLALFIALTWFIVTHLRVAIPSFGTGGLWFLSNPYDTLQYSVFFAAGYYLFFHQALLDQLRGQWVWNIVAVVSFWVLSSTLGAHHWGKYLAQIMTGVYVLSMCGILFAVAGRYFSARNRTITSLSAASYTIYLIHWPLMIALNRWEYPRELLGLKFGALILATALLSYAFHSWVVAKSGVMAFLMNGVMLHPRERSDEMGFGMETAGCGGLRMKTVCATEGLRE